MEQESRPPESTLQLERAFCPDEKLQVTAGAAVKHTQLESLIWADAKERDSGWDAKALSQRFLLEFASIDVEQPNSML